MPMGAHGAYMGTQCRANGRPWAQNVGLWCGSTHVCVCERENRSIISSHPFNTRSSRNKMLGFSVTSFKVCMPYSNIHDIGSPTSRSIMRRSTTTSGRLSSGNCVRPSKCGQNSLYCATSSTRLLDAPTLINLVCVCSIACNNR